MQLIRPRFWLVAALWVASLGHASILLAQDSYLAKGDIDVDFLLNYYTQDGDRSAVTGGIGTEEMDVVSSIIVVKHRINDQWTLRSELGIDGISSASVDNIDDAISSASKDDVRAFAAVTGTRSFGNQSLSLIGGISNEYDYRSFSAGIGWSSDLSQANTTVSGQLRFYSDTIDLYDVDGVNRGEDDRTTLDLSLGFSQILGPNTVATAEVFASLQDGFLSAPFQEVWFAPSSEFPEGRRVAERLPDQRTRFALGLGLNHSFSKRVVQRAHYRLYDDDWNVRAHTLSLETHFRIPSSRSSWIYPILRWHTQTSAENYAPALTFSGDEEFFTADPDLAEFDSLKYGLGCRVGFSTEEGWKRRLRYLEVRLTQYSRTVESDDLEALSLAFSVGWRF